MLLNLITDAVSSSKRCHLILILIIASANTGNSTESSSVQRIHDKQSRVGRRLKGDVRPMQKSILMQESRYSRKSIQSFDDDDWRYKPMNRILLQTDYNDHSNNIPKQDEAWVKRSKSQEINIKSLQSRQVAETSIHSTRRRKRQLLVDDDWRYHPRLLQDGENDDSHEESGEDNNNDKQNDDDCVTEKNYLAELVNHMLYTTPEEWTMDEVVLGFCLALIALSTVLVALCCVYGCCTVYCCCCCEGKTKSSKRTIWDDDTTVSGYGLDYQFTNDSSLV